jgi:hypothetical protein
MSNASSVMGVINMQFRWEILFRQVIGEKFSEKILVVVETSCGGMFSYEVKGPVVLFLGLGMSFVLMSKCLRPFLFLIPPY